MRKSNVRWTDHEEDTISNLVASMRLNDVSASVLELVRRAQQQLPEDRRRFIGNSGDIKHILAKIRLRCTSIKMYAQKYKDEIASQDVPTVLPTIEETLNSLTNEAIIHYLREREIPFKIILPLMVDNISSAISRLDVSNTVQELLKDISSLNCKVDDILNHITSPYRSEKSTSNEGNKVVSISKPRIKVCGLLSKQIQDVYYSCKDYAKLDFVSKDAERVASFGDPDYLFLFVDFLDHAFIDRAVSELGNDKVIRHKGGITMGINKIILLSREEYNSRNGRNSNGR